jgi:2,5-furandicarboxylate decarboxylase 1
LQASGRAVLCENLKGRPGARIAGNLLASRRLAARALGTTEQGLVDTYMDRSARRLPPVAASEVPVHEVVHRQPADVGALLPLVTHYEKDAAPFLTCGVVLARDPATGHARHGHPPHDV